MTTQDQITQERVEILAGIRGDTQDRAVRWSDFNEFAVSLINLIGENTTFQEALNLLSRGDIPDLVGEVIGDPSLPSALANAILTSGFRGNHEIAEVTMQAMIDRYDAIQNDRRQVALVGESIEQRLVADRFSVASRFNGVAASFGDAFAFIEQEATARADADTAQVNQITALQATIADPVTGLSVVVASHTSDISALVTQDAAFATQITALQAALGNNAAAITQEANVRATQDSAQAIQINTLQSQTGTLDASVSTLQTATTSLEGTAAAAFVMRARAGGATGAVEIAAWADVGEGTATRVTLTANEIGFDADMSIFEGDVESTNFVSGLGGAGFRLGQDGIIEATDIILRRVIEVASGTVNFPAFSPSQTGSGLDVDNNDSWARPSKVVFERASDIAMTAWVGPDETYLVTCGMSATVYADSGDPPDVYWGWVGEVLPLNRWSGDQSLRLKFEFWSRKVTNLDAGTIDYKIYKVS